MTEYEYYSLVVDVLIGLVTVERNTDIVAVIGEIYIY